MKNKTVMIAAPSFTGLIAFIFICAALALGLYLGTIWALSSQ